MKHIRNIKLIIPIGLPGSGKTHYTKSLCRAEDYEYIDLDDFQRFGKGSLEKFLKNKFRYIYTPRTLVFDGLWLTAKSVVAFISTVSKFINNKEEDYGYSQCVVKKIELVHWNEDRETCLHNDEGRRTQSSASTIKNHPYISEITAEFLNKIYALDEISNNNVKITVTEKFVEKATKFDKVVDDVNDGQLIIKSEEWSGGGTWGNCWGASGTISASQPLEFDEFDRFLEKLCPHIPFLTYKAIKKDCCKIVERSDRDYYGGHETLYHWECDTNILKEELIKHGIEV